jgi:hypothetical protein
MNELTTGTVHQFLKRYGFRGARLRAFRVRNGTADAATAEVRLTVRAADTGQPVRLHLLFGGVEEFRFQRRPGPGLVRLKDIQVGFFGALTYVNFDPFAEERTYSVTVDGRPAGELCISFQSDSKGTTAVTVRAESPPLAFEYRGAETWKDGRLTRLEGAGSESGRKGGVTLVAAKDAYALKAGVKEVRIRDEVWPTSGAMLSDPDRNPLVVDVLTGDVLRAKVENVGADRVTVGGKPVPVTHFRVTAGGQRWDVWYDADQRLAKRVWTRDGRTVTAELTKVRRD